MSATSSVLERLTRERGQPRGADLRGADLRGADLAGADLADCHIQRACLRGVNLIGARLTGARFEHCDLSEVVCDGADLTGARFFAVSASYASFVGCQAGHSWWELSELTEARFQRARLPGAMLRSCSAEAVDLTGADLSDASLIYSNCDRAKLSGALLARASTLASSFASADFLGARWFTTCREIIVEILTREMGDDFGRASRIGAVAVQRAWCYREWAELLKTQRDYHELALEVFRRYPESGFAAALRAGRRAT